MRGKRARLLAWATVVSMALLVGIAPRSFAQDQGIVPAGEYREGLVLGSWKLYPKIFVGAVWDTNIDQQPNGAIDPNGPQRTSRTSARAVPYLSGFYDGGIHKTSVYGVIDARFFDETNLSATTGLTHRYEAMRDLIFNFYFNYTRQTDLFTNALNFNNGAIGPNISGTPETNIPIILNPFGTTPSVNPSAYNQYTAGTSVLKTFDNNTFVTLAGTAFHIAYDHTIDLPIGSPFSTSLDGTSYWVTGRLGFNATPQLYVFAEPAGIFQRFNNSKFDTNGYRVTGGIGSADPQSLFRGEVFGGYQAQHQLNSSDTIVDANGVPLIVNGLGIPSGIPSDTHSPIYGGRLAYYPTRYWTFVAQVDQTLGISTTLSPTLPAGVPLRATNAVLQANYNLSRWWWVGARAGYTQAKFFGFDRVDDGWMAGASFNYEVWRNLLLTLDYQYSTVHSNAAFSDFTRNVYTAGLTYRY
jgi:Putative beta-barrel porin 2